MADKRDKTEKANIEVLNLMGDTPHAKRELTRGEVYKIKDMAYAQPIVVQPVCGHCERVCIWDLEEHPITLQIVPVGVCEVCGTRTKNPITFGEYIAQGHDIPAAITGNDRKACIEARKMINLMLNIRGRDGNDVEVQQ